MFEQPVATRDTLTATLAFLLLFAALAAPAFWKPDVDGSSIAASVVLAAMLAALSATDLQQYRLPDALTLPLAGLGLIGSAWTGTLPLWWSAASAVVGFAGLVGVIHAYRYIRGRPGLGMGDAKLFAASGAWVGAEALPSVMLWAALSALICALAAHWRGRPLTGTTRLPFGPFLAFATWLVWLYGPL